MQGKFFGIAVVALGAALAAPAQAQVTGTVTYEGKVPTLRPIAMDAAPECAKKHSGPVANEMLVLGQGNGMANVLVSVTKGLPAGKTYTAPTTPAVLDQNGCQYHPHVLGVMVNQPLEIKNSDGMLHNVHTLSKVNPQFNKAMPGTVTTAQDTFTKEEGVFNIKCDVHPWMQAYMQVFSNPFFAVTDKDGKFTIKDLPPGTYELTAWHEKLGTQTASVTVPGAKAVAFKFTAPAAPAK